MTPPRSRAESGPNHQLGCCSLPLLPLLPDGSIVRAGELDLSAGGEEGQPDQVINLCAITGKSPRDHPALSPSARTEDLLSSIGKRELGRFQTYLKPGQGQGAQVVVEQPGAIMKGWILITDQPIEAGAVAGTSRFDQSINGCPGQAKAGTIGRRRSRSWRRRNGLDS